MPGLFDLDQRALAALLQDEPAWRSRQILGDLYRGRRRPSEQSALPRRLRERFALDPALSLGLEETACLPSDAGATLKRRYRLEDGAEIETVWMRYPDRVTLCVSSQAGCAMGCVFCATGQGGFGRQLSAGEIVGQVVLADADRPAGSPRVSRVVFMGMGEPLANTRAVLTALERLRGDLGLSARHLTVSTVGIVPGIRRLADARLPVNLAVSLHAARDELRQQLVPIGRRYPLASLLTACAKWRDLTGRRISFEWAMMADVNDTERDVAELAGVARPLGAHVNLIPLNPTPGWPVRGSTPERITEFAAALGERGVNVTVRHTRGQAVAAACGQLARSARQPVAMHQLRPTAATLDA